MNGKNGGECKAMNKCGRSIESVVAETCVVHTAALFQLPLFQAARVFEDACVSSGIFPYSFSLSCVLTLVYLSDVGVLLLKLVVHTHAFPFHFLYYSR